MAQHIMNGAPPRDLDTDATAAEIAKIAKAIGREPREPREPAKTSPMPTPFSQRDHDHLLETVDSVANDWVMQLKADRTGSEELEQLLLERITGVKAEVTQLFLLGSAIMGKVKRDGEFREKLTSEIDKHLATHQE